MIDWAQLTLFIYITARMSGFILFNTLFGRTAIPTIFRSGLILLLSVAVYATTPQVIELPSALPVLSVRILLELAIGLMLGLVVTFFFYIPQLAGEVIDTQMAMTMNQIYDPGSQYSMTTTAQLLNAMMMLVFFAANGHHTLLELMLTSGEVVPFGGVAIGDQAFNAMLELFLIATVLAVKLCMPVLAAELVGQIGMGVLMKVIPQINVFAINIELKVIIGLVLIFMLVAPFSEFLLGMERDMLTGMRELLQLMA